VVARGPPSAGAQHSCGSCHRHEDAWWKIPTRHYNQPFRRKLGKVATGWSVDDHLYDFIIDIRPQHDPRVLAAAAPVFLHLARANLGRRQAASQ